MAESPPHPSVPYPCFARMGHLRSADLLSVPRAVAANGAHSYRTPPSIVKTLSHGILPEPKRLPVSLEPRCASGEGRRYRRPGSVRRLSDWKPDHQITKSRHRQMPALFRPLTTLPASGTAVGTVTDSPGRFYRKPPAATMRRIDRPRGTRTARCGAPCRYPDRGQPAAPSWT